MDPLNAETGAAEATRTFDQLAARHDPLLGQMAGNYHVLARAGAGAFGTVYRARDVRLDRTVALKFLNGTADAAGHRNFESEARAIARLGKHPGVVDIYAWGEHEGRCYLALEYAPESVATLLANRPEGLPVAQAVSIAAQCADALATAHRAGVIHGDIKPSNILLTDGGTRATLCDFGLARMGGATGPRGGSPAYLAPECVSGGNATPASDLYALAATLYTLLAGKPPVSVTSVDAALVDATAGRITPIAHACPGVPRAIAAAIMQALSTDPALRPANAEAFAKALRGHGAATRSATHRWQGTLRAVALAAGVVVTALGYVLVQGFLPGGGGSTAALADARLNLNRGEYEAARAGFEQYLSRQPDHAEARYGLAYSFLLEGDHEQAAREFGQLGEAAMREEGKAAVAYMADGEAARPALENAASQHPGGYAAVLLSTLDMMAGNFEGAQRRLDSVKENELPFDWQRRQYLQTLGQLLFKQGKNAAAEEIFARLEQSGTDTQGTVAADYAAMARSRRETAARADLGEQLARLKALLADQAAQGDVDAWSSRPLRIWVPPVESGNGIIALETGLADVLPWRVSRALLAQTRIPIAPVERAAEAEILAEQELAVTLGGNDGTLRLGRVMGARLLLQGRVTRLFNEEQLHLSLVDTETTAQVPVGEYTIERSMDPQAWFAKIADDLVRTVERQYPLRGVITASAGGPVLNLGSANGVAAGMVFRGAQGPLSATVTEVLDEAHSRVSVTGTTGEAPASGWRVEAAHAP